MRAPSRPLLLLLSCVFLSAACGGDDGGVVLPSTNTDGAPDGDTDGDTGGNTDGFPDDTWRDETRQEIDTTPVPALEYRFMRITDLSTPGTVSDPGADLDAVVVTKASGQAMHAARVVEYTPMNAAEIEAIDPGAVVGAPDAFADYPNATNCQLTQGGLPTYASLGGEGGSIVLEFPSPGVEDGDTVNVLELGNCDFDGGTAVPEDVSVEVSVGLDGTASWQMLGISSSPTTSLSVFGLPVVPAAP